MCLCGSTSPVWLVSFKIYCSDWSVIGKLWVVNNLIIVNIWHWLAPALYGLSPTNLKLTVKLDDGHVVKVEGNFHVLIIKLSEGVSCRTTCFGFHSLWIVFALGGMLISVKILNPGTIIWTLGSGEASFFIILPNLGVLNKSQTSLL